MQQIPPLAAFGRDDTACPVGMTLPAQSELQESHLSFRAQPRNLTNENAKRGYTKRRNFKACEDKKTAVYWRT